MTLTKREAILYFNTDILPAVKARHEKDGKLNVHERYKAWRAYTKTLLDKHFIMKNEYDAWIVPV